MNRFNWCILIFFLSSYYLVFILDFKQIINSVNDNSVRTLVLYHHYKNSFLASFHYFLLLRAKWKPRFIIVILIFCQFTPVHAPENLENAPAQVLTQLRYAVLLVIFILSCGSISFMFCNCFFYFLLQVIREQRKKTRREQLLFLFSSDFLPFLSYHLSIFFLLLTLSLLFPSMLLSCCSSFNFSNTFVGF